MKCLAAIDRVADGFSWRTAAEDGRYKSDPLMRSKVAP
jgi:hypothetical protein